MCWLAGWLASELASVVFTGGAQQMRCQGRVVIVFGLSTRTRILELSNTFENYSYFRLFRRFLLIST